MKKLLKRLGILFLLVVPALFVVNYIVDSGLRKSHMPIYDQWTDIYHSNINADVLFTGPSRTLVHISPRIIDSILHTNSYNLGMDGWTFEMQYARFKVYLQHNKKPKYIIQNVDASTFAVREDLYQYEQFLPYIHDTILLNASKHHIGEFTLPEIYFPLFKYNNHFYLIREGFNCYFNTGRQVRSKAYKGFTGNDIPWDGSFDKFKKANPNGVMSPISIKARTQFEEFLEYCKNNNITVVFDFAPVYYEELSMEKNYTILTNLIKYYADKYNIVFLNYTHDSLCYHKDYFYNSQHLNIKGADMFSIKLANDLKKIIYLPK